MGRPRIKVSKEVLERLYIHEERSPREIAEKLGCTRQTIINRLRDYGLRVRTKGEGTALAKIMQPRFPFSGDNADRAYLIGFRLGDLTVDQINKGGRTIRVSCASTRPEQIALIQDLFRDYGRIVLNGPYQNGRVSIQCLVDQSFAFLLPKVDEIPVWILDNAITFWSFLGGYSDAEAHIGISNGKVSFRLATADIKILTTIHDYLLKAGFSIPELYLMIRKGYVNSAGTVCRKDIWRLGIYNSGVLAEFLTRLIPNLRHKKRFRDALQAIKTLSNRSVQ